MNLRRSLSTHQRRLLERIASGVTRIVLHEGRPAFEISERWLYAISAIPVSKPRGRNTIMSGSHDRLSACELIQRGLIVRDGENFTLSKEAARVFGSPPKLPPPKKVVAMSRTRPVRDPCTANPNGEGPKR